MTNNSITNVNRIRRSSIRRSTRADLEEIHAWLVDEESRDVDGNFLCNWNVIEESHHRGELLVYIDGKTGQAVAFQLGRLVQPGILQVRQEYRKSGIGRKMVERCITLGKKYNQHLLHIECTPSTSIPFWQRMGFTLIESVNTKNHAYRVIDKPLQLPEQGVDVEVVIRFFPECRKWKSEAMPYATYSLQARRILDGTIYLAQRIQTHERTSTHHEDVVVEIEVDGISQFLDKAKYAAAQQIGIMSCTNGFYIDRILTLSAT